MDWRKHVFFDHFFSALSSKKRVLSGFGLGVVASLLVLSLLMFVNTPATTTSSPSFLSWFFSFPAGNSNSDSPKTPDFLLRNETDVDIQKVHDGNSSKSSFSEGGSDLGKTQFKNYTGDAKNSTGLGNGQPVLLKTHGGRSTRKEGNGSFSEGSTPLEKSHHEGNFFGKGLSSPDAGGQVIGKRNVENVTKDDGMTRVFEKKDGDGGKDLGIKEIDTKGKNVSGSSEGRVSDGAVSKNNGPVSTRKKVGFSKKCDIFNGRWVRDGTKPYYPGGSCPYLDDDFNCHKNGRPDDEFLRWKWQPYDCNIPSLNATDFLSRLRGKRLLFVGDSLNRNMWESLVCILRHSVKKKSRVYEASGRSEFKTRGYYSFRFEDYKCSVDYVRSPFLVRELFYKNANGSLDEKLRLDLLDQTTTAYRQADIIVFNTGHWWTHEKTSRGIDYYQEGDRVYPILKVMEAYKKALTTWARWVDKNINRKKTRVVFRGYSLTHFRGGQWNSGGACHKEIEPIFNETFLSKYPAKMMALEGVLKQMKTPVIYLNISRLTEYRKDGHPSIYRKKYNTVEEQSAAERSQDCSHWCLPGIPDTWNELLYASLLLDGKGSWR